MVKGALFDEIKRLATSGLTNEELARAKKKLIGQQRIANQSNDSFGYMAVLDELFGLRFDHYKSLEKEIEAISVRDIQQVASKYFQQPYVLATVRPPQRSDETALSEATTVQYQNG
jgi:zinc protease